MRCKPLARPLIVAVGVLALVASACGESATTGSAQETADLHRFLIRADEMPGFPLRGEPDLVSDLSAFVESDDLDQAQEQRLREHGFEAFTAQMIGDPEGEAGVSNLTLFATQAGAARELEYLRNNKEKEAPPEIENFERFDVPDVPTAFGWTYVKPGGSRTADIQWLQGRCVMYLGSEPAYIDRLRAAVKAIYEHTGGRCP
ncbi:MAG TPA: hypothetical protein VFA34_07865 [Actinomycetota bacterium]|jgi:hypothetical protein|nr:hypothetical protein [Actinomycetota bacterium]